MGYYEQVNKKQNWCLEHGRRVIEGVVRNRRNHDAFVSGLRAIWKHDNFQKLPRWSQSYVQGYLDALEKQMITKQVEWRIQLDGQYITSAEVPAGRWPEVVPGGGGFFWVDESGSLYPWYPYGSELFSKRKPPTFDSFTVVRYFDKDDVRTESMWVKYSLTCEWEYIGEGFDGQYDHENPNDVPRLRFSCYKTYKCEEPVPIPDASYCTLMTPYTDKTILVAYGLAVLDALESGTYKHTLEKITHWNKDYVRYGSYYTDALELDTDKEWVRS